jgi:hypothetical protein
MWESGMRRIGLASFGPDRQLIHRRYPRESTEIEGLAGLIPGVRKSKVESEPTRVSDSTGDSLVVGSRGSLLSTHLRETEILKKSFLSLFPVWRDGAVA